MNAYKTNYASTRTSNEAHASYLARNYGTKAKEIFLRELEERKKAVKRHAYLEGWKKRVPNGEAFYSINFRDEQWMD